MDSRKNKNNYYKVLNVKQNASFEEIKESYKNLALKLHPDHNKEDPITATKQMQELNAAYETLSDSQKRKKYDFTLPLLSEVEKKSDENDIDMDDYFRQFINIPVAKSTFPVDIELAEKNKSYTQKKSLHTEAEIIAGKPHS